MNRPPRLLVLPAALVALAALAGTATAPPATPRSPAASDALAREILAELVGLDTTHAVGSAKAAGALAARFRAAGFPAEDVYIGGPKPDKMNIVVRLHGRGQGRPCCSTRTSTWSRPCVTRGASSPSSSPRRTATSTGAAPTT